MWAALALGTGAASSAAHPFNLEINGVDVIASANMDSIRVEMPGPGTNGSFEVDLWDPTATLSISEWDEVRFIEHAATRPILFGGFVQSVRYSAWAVTGRTVSLRCVGYGILLDKKVLLADYTGLSAGIFVSRHLVSLVNRYGGRVTATCAGDALTGGPWYTTAVHGVSDPSDDYTDPGYAWFAGNVDSTTAYTLDADQTLRSAMDMLSSSGNWLDAVDPATLPAPITYWVDSAARVMAFPEMPSTHVLATHTAAQYDGGTVPGLSVTPSAGTYRVVALAVEREDTDRITAAHIQSSTAAGTGTYYGPSLARAGDLYAVTQDDTSLTAADVATKGAGIVRTTTAATMRASIALQATAPLDVWPGRNIRVTDARVGLAGEDWRMTGCRVTFGEGGARTYEVEFGGNFPLPSMARRQGRYKTSRRA